MKLLALIIMLALALKASAHDHPSVHGMLLVGSERIYLSHLPMFHAPHDYQLITEVELDAPSVEVYRQSLESSPESVYTLVPEPFSLPAMVNRPRPFKASLYVGHFERGGRMIARNLQVQIKTVVYFKKLNPTAPRPELGQYLVFGHAREQFLAHVVTSRPNFDQVLKLVPRPQRKLGLVVLPQTDATPLSAPSRIESFDIDAEIYLEHADLAH